MAKILIVDDDADMRNLHKMRLSDTYEILETEDPEEALDWLSRTSPPPSCSIL